MSDWIAKDELQRVVDNLRVVGANLSDVATDAQSSLPFQEYPKNIDVADLMKRIGALTENIEDLILKGESMLQEVESVLVANENG